MTSEDKIQIRVIGNIGNEPLSPQNYDISEIRDLFSIIENLLYPNQKLHRPRISYSIESGSVINIFQASKQAVVMFMATANLICAQGNLNGLELPTARGISDLQKSAIKNNFIYEIGLPNVATPILTISKETKYHIDENLWAEADLYFYGQLVDAGGSENINIHIKTTDYGILKISTEKEYLKNQQENILYKNFTIRAIGRQNINTGEIDTSSLTLLEMNQFDPRYNEDYLQGLIERATPHWKDIQDTEEWLSQIRGV